MGQPLFSVIIAAYNRGNMLRSALETISFQTCGDFECLAVDDGSTDNVPRVLASFAKDKRFRMISWRRNQGMNAARNEALSAASGRYVTFLDSDDFWLPERLEEFAALIAKSPDAGFIFSNAYVLRFNRIIGLLFDPARRFPQGPVPGHYAVGDRHLPYVTTNLAIRRDAFERWGQFKPGLKATDTELFTRFLAQGLPVAVIKRPLAVRRIHEDQITAGHAENYRQSLAAVDSSGASEETRRALREEIARDVAMHLIKAGRPAEARSFLNETMGPDARRFGAWRLSFVPAFFLRFLRDLRGLYLRVRSHPRLLAADRRRAFDLIRPLLDAELMP